MEKIIKIIEENNQLKFDGEYEPIVCGNSIYSLQFQFGDTWNSCNHKTAVFVVDGKYVLIEFTGNTVNVPIMPNASCLSVSLLSGNGEDELATTALKINLKTTPAICGQACSDEFQNYLQQIHSFVNKIEKGDIVVNTASVAENVANANILINGNFQINQRGKQVYDGGQQYTVDRWLKNSNSVLEVLNKGVCLKSSGSGALIQYLENFVYDSHLTLSVKLNGKIFSATAQMPSSKPTVNQEFISLPIQGVGYLKLDYVVSKDKMRVYLYHTQSGEFNIEYFKLEVGMVATPYCVKSYAEEFMHCQRYYQTVKNMRVSSCLLQGGLIDFTFTLVATLRTNPTIALGEFTIQSINGATVDGFSLSAYGDGLTSFRVRATKTGHGITNNASIVQNANSPIVLDAEIY